MIPLEEAQRRILGRIGRLPPRAVPVGEALGCVTSVAIVSTEAVPPFANSAMDGFALRAADTAGAGARLRVVGVLSAGQDPAGLRVGRGEAIRIMTGAAVPDGADSVVMVERTTGGKAPGDLVTVEIEVAEGSHIRPAGEDLMPGQETIPAGTVLGPGHLGLVASIGLSDVPVHPRARVGVLSTGDELVEGPAPLRPGQIRDSNRHALLALVRQAGCHPVDLGLVGDDKEAIEAALAQAAQRCDAVVTSGGVSVGDFDYMVVVLQALGGDAEWMQVAIKPAKPLLFGLVGEVPLFGLPGNPASAMVSFELFARPALRRLMGHPEPSSRAVRAVVDESLSRRPDGKLHLVRVRAESGEDGRLHVRSTGSQGSNLLGSMAAANALALLPDGDGTGAGNLVEILLLTSFWS
ncbi:MAG: molybdopterin molybdotransferase MoeA [Actinobacteria bacterium]|nr:molybdopterin molybdotransferase MoeA [Actinomycetota bacterium]